MLTDEESCLFFVGSYRSNEVGPDHYIYRFMHNLDKVGIQSTELSLFGINYNAREYKRLYFSNVIIVA